jgi:predicted kinase
MPTLYVMVGPPASGKTTYREKWLTNLPVVSPDLYGSLKPGERWWAGGSGETYAERIGLAWSWAWKQFAIRLQKGADFVFEATLPNRVVRGPIVNIAKAFGYTVICVYCVEGLQTLLERNAKREASVPPEVVARMFLNDEEPMFSEGWDEIVVANATEGKSISAIKGES